MFDETNSFSDASLIEKSARLTKFNLIPAVPSYFVYAFVSPEG